MEKITPLCYGIPKQLDPYESVLNMAIREEAKKSGKTRKRDF